MAWGRAVTIEIAFLLVLLAVMAYLFLSERLPVDLTAFLGLVVLLFGGYLTPAEAFQGFSSPAVITMLSVFILGAALLETGVADLVGRRIHVIAGSSETRLVVVLMVLCGVLSAFMNNIAATAVLMPAVAAIARRAAIAPSRLFMPLAFAAVLGGTTTLIGTPPNILTTELLAEHGLEPFSLFSFTPIGVVLLGAGTLFVATAGRRLLPAREEGEPAAATAAGDLLHVYQIEKRLFSLRIPADSPLHGLTLGQSRLGNALGVKLLAVARAGGRRLAPDADTVLRAGDVLWVEGSAADLEEVLRLRSLEVRRARLEELPLPVQQIQGVRARVTAGSSLAGRSLRELRFRERFGLVVVGVESGGSLRRAHLGEHVLRPGDELLALGRAGGPAATGWPDLEVVETGVAALSQLADELFLIRVPESSSLVDTTIGSSRLGELTGLTVVALLRGEEAVVAPSPEEKLRAEDRLLLAAEPSRLETLEELGDVVVEVGALAPLESEEVGVVEAAVAPRSEVVGKTLRELDFRGRYGLLVLALWREGVLRHAELGRVPLRFGDALLLYGPRERIARLASEPDFVVLSPVEEVPRRTGRAPFALACLALMVALVVSGSQPIHVASFTAASLALLSGALTMREAYRAIEWRAIFLVAAVLPVGVAMERTGAAVLLADGVSRVAGPLGEHATLAALVVLASLLSQALDGAPAVVLLAPVVIHAAEGLGTSPYPMMMGVSLAASAAFMTPFSHKANLLVMGAGGYRSRDYFRLGAPLTVVVLALIVLLVPLLFPF